jgi:hypothetical protein
VTRDLVLKKKMMACCMTDVKKGWRVDLVVRLGQKNDARFS